MAMAKTQADAPISATVTTVVTNVNVTNASTISVGSSVDNLSTVAKEDAKVLSAQTDVFLSHDWGAGQLNHNRVSRINDYLKKNGLNTWFDENSDDNSLGGGNLDWQLSKAIEYASIVIVFVTANYATKINSGNKFDNCWKEYNCAKVLRKHMIPVVMEKDMRDQMKWGGMLGMHLGSDLYVPFDDDKQFDTSAANLLGFISKELKKIRQP